MSPPILKVEALANVSVPPELMRLAVNPARSKMPADTLRSPAMLMLRDKTTGLVVLDKFRLLNVVEKEPPIDWTVVPLKVRVANPAVNAVADELLAQFPLTFILKLLPLSVPAERVRLLFTVIAEGNNRPLELLSVKL